MRDNKRCRDILSQDEDFVNGADRHLGGAGDGADGFAVGMAGEDDASLVGVDDAGRPPVRPRARAARASMARLPLIFSSNTFTHSPSSASCCRAVSCLLVLTRTRPTNATTTAFSFSKPVQQQRPSLQVGERVVERFHGGASL